MQEFYSFLGKSATRFPSCLLCSYLLSIALKVTSITEWCALLKVTPLFAVLSGFSVDDTPGVGTFYDFFTASGSLTKIITLTSLNTRNQKPKRRAVKHLMIPTVLLPGSSLCWNALNCQIQILFT